jgi:hypothetical protein
MAITRRRTDDFELFVGYLKMLYQLHRFASKGVMVVVVKITIFLNTNYVIDEMA